MSYVGDNLPARRMRIAKRFWIAFSGQDVCVVDTCGWYVFAARATAAPSVWRFVHAGCGSVKTIQNETCDLTYISTVFRPIDLFGGFCAHHLFCSRTHCPA